jgi:hypothetical protein
MLLAILMVMAIVPFMVLTVFSAAPDQPTNIRWEDKKINERRKDNEKVMAHHFDAHHGVNTLLRADSLQR